MAFSVLTGHGEAGEGGRPAEEGSPHLPLSPSRGHWCERGAHSLAAAAAPGCSDSAGVERGVCCGAEAASQVEARFFPMEQPAAPSPPLHPWLGVSTWGPIPAFRC